MWNPFRQLTSHERMVREIKPLTFHGGDGSDVLHPVIISPKASEWWRSLVRTKIAKNGAQFPAGEMDATSAALARQVYLQTRLRATGTEWVQEKVVGENEPFQVVVGALSTGEVERIYLDLSAFFPNGFPNARGPARWFTISKNKGESIADAIKLQIVDQLEAHRQYMWMCRISPPMARIRDALAKTDQADVHHSVIAPWAISLIMEVYFLSWTEKGCKLGPRSCFAHNIRSQQIIFPNGTTSEVFFDCSGCDENGVTVIANTVRRQTASQNAEEVPRINGENARSTNDQKPQSRVANRVATTHAPSLVLWLGAVLLGAVGMIFVSPITGDLVAIRALSALLLSQVAFLFGWVAGIRTFYHSCQLFRRLHHPMRLEYSLPILLAAIAGIGIFGKGYWWAFAAVVGFMGHRKGTQRAWWASVADLASVFRRGIAGTTPLSPTDEDAIMKAKDAM